MLLLQITSMMEPDDKSGWGPNQLIWKSAVISYSYTLSSIWRRDRIRFTRNRSKSIRCGTRGSTTNRLIDGYVRLSPTSRGLPEWKGVDRWQPRDPSRHEASAY